MGMISTISALWQSLNNRNESTSVLWLGGTLAIIFSWVAYRFVVSVYRLYLHPLAQFPGTRAACLSDRWAYDIGKQGFPEKTFEKLHKEYNSPVLRIRPNELHISDVQQYKVIYNQQTNFYKEPQFYDGFNTPHTLFAETNPVLHKQRRQLLNSMFSRAGVFKLEPIMHDKIKMVMSKCGRLCKSQTVDLYNAFRCLTTEVVSEFAFARSAGMIEESQNSFEASFLTGFDAAANSIADMQYNPPLRRLSRWIPRSLLKKMNRELGCLMDLIEYAESSMLHFHKTGNNTPHPVVFENLQSLAHADQAAEAVDVLVAGSDTTATTLTTALLHILRSPEVERKLVAAIREAFPAGKEMSLLELEKIDYLTGCVKESIRLGMAVPGRLPRVVPGGGAPPFVVAGKVVPPGTIVSMSAYTMNTSKEIWGANAESFVPERWIGHDTKILDQHLSSFSKGVRMCIGINVAYAEITLALGYIFSTFKMSLPKDLDPSGTRDVFTLQYLEPGLPVHLERL